MLRVAPEIFELFPGLRIATAEAHGLDNRAARPDIDERLRSAWGSAAERIAPFGNPQSHPRIAPWRTRMKAAGAHPRDYPSSVEALARGAANGGAPFTLSPLVDLYNAISLEHLVPAGAFDLAGAGDEVDLRLTRGGESFDPLSGEGPQEVGPDEVAYLGGDEVLTRHFVWRQSRAAAITPETTGVLFLAEVLGEVGPDVAADVARAFDESLRAHFGVEPRVAVLSAAEPVV